MALFKTFKGHIETQQEGGLLKKGDIFFFHPENHHLQDKVIYNVRHEIFQFSKEDIIFSPRQKKQYENYLQLHPVSGHGTTFSDGVKYTLHRLHEKGETKYSIEVDGHKADLILNWCNRQKIEWVQGRKINWKIWQVIIPSLALIAFCIFGYLNYTKTTATAPTTTTDTLPKKNTNQLPSHGVDTIKKSDSINTLKVVVGTTK